MVNGRYHKAVLSRAIAPALLAGAFLFVQGCTGGPADTRPHVWRTSSIDYYLNTEATDLTETTVRETFQRWQDATHFTFTYRGRAPAGLRRDGKNTVSFLLKWPSEVPAGTIGYCKTWYDGKGNIVESDIIFNMSLAGFTTTRTRHPGFYYIEGILAHEIGHLVGLDDMPLPGCLMNPLSTPAESYGMGRLDPVTLAAYRSLYNRVKAP